MQQWKRAVLELCSLFSLFVLFPWLNSRGEILEAILYTICAPKQSQNAASQAPGWISKLLLFILRHVFTGCWSLRPLLPTHQLGGIKVCVHYPPIHLQLEKLSTRCWEHQSVKENEFIHTGQRIYAVYNFPLSDVYYNPCCKICLHLQYLVMRELMKTQATFQGWQFRMRATSALFC